MPNKLTKVNNCSGKELLDEISKKVNIYSTLNSAERLSLIDDILTIPNYFNELNSLPILETGEDSREVVICTLSAILDCKVSPVKDALMKSYYELILKYFDESVRLNWYLRDQKTDGPCLHPDGYAQDLYAGLYDNLVDVNKLYIYLRDAFVMYGNRTWKRFKFNFADLNFLIYISQPIFNDPSSKIKKAWNKLALNHSHYCFEKFLNCGSNKTIEALIGYAESEYLLSLSCKGENKFSCLTNSALFRVEALHLAEDIYLARKDYDENEYCKLMLLKLECCESQLQMNLAWEAKGYSDDAAEARKKVVKLASTVNPFICSGLFAHSYSNLLIKIYRLSVGPPDYPLTDNYIHPVWPSEIEGIALLNESIKFSRDIALEKNTEDSILGYINWLKSIIDEMWFQFEPDGLYNFRNGIEHFEFQLIVLLREMSIKLDRVDIWFMLIERIELHMESCYLQDEYLEAETAAIEAATICSKLFNRTENVDYQNRASKYQRCSVEYRDLFNASIFNSFDRIQWYGKVPDNI